MKQPKPWFRASKSAWYVEHNLKQIRLGEHPEGAPPPKKTKSGWNAPPPILNAFYKLMATDPANLPTPERIAVALVCDLFLDHSQKHHSPACYANYKHFLQAFTDAYGRNPAAEVKPLHVTRWLDDHPTWKGARRHAVIAVKRAFSWADQQRVLSSNPLRTLKADRANRRTRVLTRDELAEILAAIRDRPFREFVGAMLETGCRPSEVARVTAANVRLELGVWAFDQHKTSKKTDEPRIVYLTPAMVELSRRLVALYPEGPLFRGPRGKAAFTRQNIRCRFRRLREKLPHLRHFVCYNVRHTFATRALVNGVGVAQVAELLGHSSTEMVSKTYGHLADQVAHMREAARKATGG
jgi:integrase